VCDERLRPPLPQPRSELSNRAAVAGKSSTFSQVIWCNTLAIVYFVKADASEIVVRTFISPSIAKIFSLTHNSDCTLDKVQTLCVLSNNTSDGHQYHSLS